MERTRYDMDLNINNIKIEHNVSLEINEPDQPQNTSSKLYNSKTILNRSLVTTALATLKELKWHKGVNMKCLDAAGAVGVSGLLWKKHVTGVDVCICDIRKNAYDLILHNSKLNKLSVEVENKDAYASTRRHLWRLATGLPIPGLRRHSYTRLPMTEKSGFESRSSVLRVIFHSLFMQIHLETSRGVAMYFDAAFRNITDHGVVAITSTDDAAMQAVAPELALRHYGGVITKTMYQKELGIRLILSSMARAAAIYNKGIHPLCCAMNKSSLTVMVAVKKGASHADQSLGFLRKVLHCTVCQERVLCPDTQFCVESPSSLLSCQCATSSVGKVLKELGPVWSGELSHKGFLLDMSQQAIKFPWSQAVGKVMVELLDEIECSSIRNKRRNSNQSNGTLAKIQKVDHEPEQSGNTDDVERKFADNSTTEGDKCTVELKYDESPSPMFYYNIHHHSPKSHPMRPLNTVVQLLRQAGFRACRTPLDLLSVRTSATLKQLQEVLLKSYS
uniref:tRNA (guanine(26)-N(2))-dimethyltransferase n=1 Tax=Timema cristinae TaxID=61476 RepID=A0A7R9GSR3_TIMCR|nr:unnamed protein product [Timema cristinae]